MAMWVQSTLRSRATAEDGGGALPARAWTAPVLWRFDAALSITGDPSNLRTILRRYQFVTNMLRIEITLGFRNFRSFSPSLPKADKVWA